MPLQDLAEIIKKLSFKLSRAGELVGREAARRLGIPFGIIDLSLAPTPVPGDSVANILEAMGFERAGTHGTTAALALLTDAVKKGGAMASGSVGGMSGAFIPVSEDAGMIEAAQLGALSLDKLEAWTSVCSVGIDMVAGPSEILVISDGSTHADWVAMDLFSQTYVHGISPQTFFLEVITGTRFSGSGDYEMTRSVTGKRVGVIGTGSSAIQSIPIIAKHEQEIQQLREEISTLRGHLRAVRG